MISLEQSRMENRHRLGQLRDGKVRTEHAKNKIEPRPKQPRRHGRHFSRAGLAVIAGCIIQYFRDRGLDHLRSHGGALGLREPNVSQRSAAYNHVQAHQLLLDLAVDTPPVTRNHPAHVTPRRVKQQDLIERIEAILRELVRWRRRLPCCTSDDASRVRTRIAAGLRGHLDSVLGDSRVLPGYLPPSLLWLVDTSTAKQRGSLVRDLPIRLQRRLLVVLSWRKVPDSPFVASVVIPSLYARLAISLARYYRRKKFFRRRFVTMALGSNGNYGAE